MKIKDVLRQCLKKLAEDDFLNSEELTDAQTKLKEELMGFVNIVYREIVSEYMPLVEQQKVALEKGVLSFDGLERRMLYPISLYTADGEKLQFRAYTGRLLCGNFSGEAILTYAYMPEEDLTDADEIQSGWLTEGAFSDGVLAQFYFAHRVYDLAKSFDSDFRFKISLLRYRGRRIAVKAGRWRS